MRGKRASGQDGVAALGALTDDILTPISSADLAEAERRLKLAAASVKLRQALVETLDREAQSHGEDDAPDAAGEERLREALYHRLVALARAIDAEEAAGGDPAGAGDADPDGLAAVGATGAKAARRALDKLAVPGGARRRKDAGRR